MSLLTQRIIPTYAFLPRLNASQLASIQRFPRNARRVGLGNKAVSAGGSNEVS